MLNSSEIPPHIHIHDFDFELFLSSEQISKRIDELGDEISNKFSDQNPIFIPILTGAYAFAGSLFSRFNFPYSVDFMKIASYGKEMHSSGEPNIPLMNHLDVQNRNVVIIEDIIETGTTADLLLNIIEAKNPLSIEIVSLFLKPGKYKGKLLPKYVGFEITDEFIIGFGMDYAEEGRYLKDIYQLKS